jgi:hypothetical protein
MFDGAGGFLLGLVAGAVEFAIAAAGFALAAVVLGAAGVRVAHIVQRRGRTRGPGSASGWIFVQIWLTVACLSLVASKAPPMSTTPWRRGLELGVAVVGSALLGAVLSLSVALLLPARRRRGTSTNLLGGAAAALLLLSWILRLAAIPLSGLFLWWAWGTGDRVTGTIAGLCLAVAVLRFADILDAGVQRLAPSSEDAEREVLYLRPFDEEHRRFAGGLSFERFIAEEVRRIGVLVALGNPTDRLPPAGARRLYVADNEWQRGVEDAAERAVCIVGATWSSANLRWEMTRLRQLGLQSKLVLLSPPQPETEGLGAPEPANPRAPHRRLRGVRRVANDARSGLAAMKDGDAELMQHSWAFGRPPIAGTPVRVSPWETFVGELRSCGYQVAVFDPGPGAVLTFDAQARLVLLDRGATTASEFVDAVLRTLPPS